MGGQTALNTAMALDENGVLERYGVELIGANGAVIARAEDRELFREAMHEIGLETPRGALVGDMDAARRAMREIGLPLIVRPSFTLGGTGGGVAYNPEEFESIVSGRPRRLARRRGAGRGIGARLEGIRDGGGPRPG